MVILYVTGFFLPTRKASFNNFAGTCFIVKSEKPSLAARVAESNTETPFVKNVEETGRRSFVEWAFLANKQNMKLK